MIVKSKKKIPIVMHLARCIFTTKISRILFFILFLIGLGHFIVQYWIFSPSEILHAHNGPDGNDERHYKTKKQIDELHRIKRSVSSELLELESKRNALLDEISNFQSLSVDAEKDAKKAQTDLDSLKRQILQAKNEKIEIMSQHPKMAPPVRILPGPDDNVDLPPPPHFESCAMYDCFDYSRCSLTSRFPVYVYPLYTASGAQFFGSISPYIMDASLNGILGNPYVTSDPAIACLYVVIIGEVEQDSLAPVKPSATSQFFLLPHWHGDGRNHLIIHMSRESTTQNLLLGVNVGRAMIAQSSFFKPNFRNGFDIVLPSLMSTIDKAHLTKSADTINDEFSNVKNVNVIMQVPIMRKFFLSFFGHWSLEKEVSQEIKKAEEKLTSHNIHKTVIDHLLKMTKDESKGKIEIVTSCPGNRIITTGFRSEWGLCGDTESRLLLLSQSTFSLIIASDNTSVLSTPILVTRLAESLHSGAVPVILGSHVTLPFHEYIDWTKAAIVLPKGRITELTFLLSSYPHSDISFMRRRGQFLYDTYFSSAKSVLDAAIALIRSRLNIPPMAVQDEISNVIKHNKYEFEKEVSPGDAKSEFAVPPPEGKIDSVKYVRNFTSVTIDAGESWNSVPGPFHLFTALPSDRMLPSDAKFLGSSLGFRPIGEGEGGVGEVFQQSLGGNVPREQFTIVILTYEREEVLMQSVQRLKGLPHLNKVIVVWNSPEPPSEELQWPDIEVEVTIIHPKHNSLNNRFIPFAEIDTDAVLSIDDDAHLRHDEILFGFRVWRECRERVVGFPGRYHAWDLSENQWRYNSDYSCELSMVLTGAAFFHKYYMYMYTHWMPQEIRDKVDEFMNCEDIAMNFLVSHLTRLPPVKVTSRWTFRCPGCPEALSQSQSHFEERHVCINYFVKIFGYMPLLTTQFRVDSILFKTRLPHDKQKCFKFI